MMYIAYEYETALGNTVRKLVTCKTQEEYKRVKARIEEAGLTVITFDLAYSSKFVH